MLKLHNLIVLCITTLVGCSYYTYVPGHILKVTGNQQAIQNQRVQLNVWASGGYSGQYAFHEARLDVDQAAKVVKVSATLSKTQSWLGGAYTQMVNPAQFRQLSFVPQTVGTYRVQAENFLDGEGAQYMFPPTERGSTSSATFDIHVLPQ